MKHRIYIDEVGNPDLRSSDNPNHRFLSLTGVVVALDYVRSTLHPDLEALKVAHFGSHPDEPVILHRKEILHGKHPFEALRASDKRAAFDAHVLGHMRDWEYIVLSVCIDKRRHRDTYQVWRYDPYHYCLAVLLERFVFFLDQADGEGDVMAESRGGKEDRRLKESFLRLMERGTDFVDPDRFAKRLTSRQLKVKPKTNNIAGLQLADLLAHPSRNEILLENGYHGIKLGPFAEKVVALLAGKYYQRKGVVYGKKML